LLSGVGVLGLGAILIAAFPLRNDSFEQPFLFKIGMGLMGLAFLDLFVAALVFSFRELLRGRILLLAGLILGTLAFGVAVVAKDSHDAAGWTLVAVGVAGLLFVLCVLTTKCPNCKQYFAKQVLNSQVLDERTVYRTVTRTDVHRNTKGVRIGSTDRTETVPVKQQFISKECFCKKCQHSWVEAGWR
jgi:hypothetical protein